MKNDIKLINFIDLNLEEKNMVLSWRNHPNIKKWMYTTDDILLKEHLDFINSLRNKKDKLYFVVRQNDEYIGVINFINITLNTLDMGIYAKSTKKGVGNILLEEIIKYSFESLKVKKILAEVFEENNKAINLYKKFNFKQTDKRIVNRQKVICMELKNENR